MVSKGFDFFGAETVDGGTRRREVTAHLSHGKGLPFSVLASLCNIILESGGPCRYGSLCFVGGITYRTNPPAHPQLSFLIRVRVCVWLVDLLVNLDQGGIVERVRTKVWCSRDSGAGGSEQYARCT